ncbi:hypothetical protein D3C85_804470 [compost metagenome]
MTSSMAVNCQRCASDQKRGRMVLMRSIRLAAVSISSGPAVSAAEIVTMLARIDARWMQLILPARWA